jgi:hypothetical protein
VYARKSIIGRFANGTRTELSVLFLLPRCGEQQIPDVDRLVDDDPDQQTKDESQHREQPYGVGHWKKNVRPAEKKDEDIR